MTKIHLSIFINLIITGCTLYAIRWNFRVHNKNQSNQSPKQRRSFFRFYTTNSNVLSAFASFIVLVSECICLSNSQTSLPDWVMLLRFVGSTSVAVTMLTVIFFLAPHMGWDMLYKGDSLYMHILGPVLAVLAFTLLEKDCKIAFPLSLLGASTVLVYGIIYMYQVVIKGENAGGWPDFYGFNRKPGMWKISFPVMILGGCVISLLLAFIHNL